MRIKQEELQTRKKYIHKGMFTNYVSDRRGGEGVWANVDIGGQRGEVGSGKC